MYIKTSSLSLSLSLYETGINFLKSLGYNSERTHGEQNLTFEDFKDFTNNPNINPDKIFSDHWNKAELLFQLTEEDLTGQNTLFKKDFTFSSANDVYKSYMFFALELKGDNYSRTQLASITREMNKPFVMPVFILFKYGNKLTLSVIDRRLNKKDQSLDVLEKITMIKDVRIDNPHHAHIDIFYDLSKDQLYNKFHFTDFDGLHKAWKETLNIKELNNRFYKELSNWYFWAMQNVVFPGATSEQDKESLFAVKEKQKEFNAQCLIRLICRLLFVWFIKEKHLVSEKFFIEDEIKKLIRTDTNESSAYYKAILQNLFFAVLNQEQGEKRDYKKDNNYGYGNELHYKHLIKNPDDFKKEFENVPFLNGGLFECLDEVIRENKDNSGKEVTRKYYFDGFSDRKDNKLRVPDELFFEEKERVVDLSAEFEGSAKYKNVKVRGLLNILNSYKFTVEENTPVEEDVALDPELLGRVFENLLASFNPETKTTARKATGSYYTPREIVDYMVNESIKACLENTLVNQFGLDEKVAKEKLDILINYNDKGNPFEKEEEITRALIERIDSLKILDPACGSGAFPMGMLHKLVYILEKLDYDNRIWKETQSKKLGEEIKKTMDVSYSKPEREQLQKDLNEIFDNSMYDPNYARKMYIIENCIYGVDIQPVATQISKLRFFISLITEQKTDPSKPNCGVRPLPNLETKFIAANTLIDITNSGFLKNKKIIELEKKLKEIRHKIFSVKTVETKLKYRQEDKEKRNEIAEELSFLGLNIKESQALAKWDPYDKKTSSSWFNPEWMFGIKDGFDIVIGNPPYISAPTQLLSDELKIQREELSRCRRYNTLYQKWDLYIAFMEFGLLSLNQGGVLTMIVPYPLTNQLYGQVMRKVLTTDYNLKELVDLNGTKVFESATVSNCIPIVVNEKPLSKNLVISKINEDLKIYNSFVQNYKDLVQDEKTQVWNCTEKKHENIKFKNMNILGDYCYISVGMVLNADEKKAKGEFVKADLISETKDSIHCRKFIESKDIKPYTIINERFLEYGTKRCPDQLRRPTFKELYEHNKLIFNRLGELQVAYDNVHYLQSDSSFMALLWWDLHGVENKSISSSVKKFSKLSRIEMEKLSKTVNLKYLLGIMNSKYASVLLTNIRGGDYHIYPEHIRNIPIPSASTAQQQPIINLVDQILTKKQSDPNSDTSELEHKIDLLVYDLYGLTADEIAIVEGKN